MWNTSFSNFRRFGPDHPGMVDFDQAFPGGAHLVTLPRDRWSDVVNQNTVSLDKSLIRDDVDPRKWKRLLEHLESGESVAPPWGVVVGARIGIAQGKHRFQWAVLQDLDDVPVAVNEETAAFLKSTFGIESIPMDA